MKTYTIKDIDIMFNGKIYPEGSTINLDDKDAQSLSAFLVILLDSEVSTNKNSIDKKTINKRSK
jgi:hypothetical protein